MISPYNDMSIYQIGNKQERLENIKSTLDCLFYAATFLHVDFDSVFGEAKREEKSHSHP